VTEENVENLGFIDWDKCKNLIEEGLVKGSTLHTRKLVMIAQLVSLGKRFGVKKAKPDYAILEKEVVSNGFAH
jgi:asparagine synthase (glutamine-hydrolysing)